MRLCSASGRDIARAIGKIVHADDPVVADGARAQSVEFESGIIVHICKGSKFMGNASPHPSTKSEKSSRLCVGFSSYFPVQNSAS